MKASDLPAVYAEMNEWLRSRRRFLVVTHLRPDGDAIGSALALARALRKLGLHSSAYFTERPPINYEPFLDEDMCIGHINLTEFDHIVAVDCGTADRLGLPNELTYEELGLPTANIDHHISNDEYGDVNLVDPEAAATSEILVWMFGAFGFPLGNEAATQLLLGLTTDTGCFRFNNTDAAALRAGSWLIDNGGNYEKVMAEVYFNTPLSKMRLQARAVESIKLAFNDRLAYFYVTDELLHECDADPEDAEDLVDIVRTISGVEIVCRMQRIGEDVRYSFRSQNPKRPILGVARKLNGGGHPLAAGATLHKSTLEEATQAMLDAIEELFNG